MVRSWVFGLVLLSAVGGRAQEPAAALEPAASAPASAPAAPSIAQLVLKVVGQFDAKTRRDAAVAILGTGSPEGVQALLDVFKTENNEAAKLAVCEAITQTRAQEPAFKTPLLNLSSDKNAALREAAIAALAGYQDPQIQARIEALKNEQERKRLENVLAATMQLAYDRTTGNDLMPLLQGWLKHELPFVRATGLGIIYQALTKKNTEPPEEIRVQLKALLNDPDEAVRKRAVEVLRELQEARALEARLPQEPSEAVRELIYHALGHIRDPGSIPICVAGLEDPADLVAAKAASALARLAEFTKRASATEVLQAAVEGLLQRAKNGLDNDELREGVIDAMANIADPKFLDLLARHAGADETVPAIRQMALQGIGRIGDATRIGLVIERLAAEQDPVILGAALEALGKLGSQIEHLQPIRDKLDPKGPPAVQQKAWEAYRLIFTQLEPKDQQRVIASWPEEAIRLAADPQLSPENRAALANRLLESARAMGKSDPQAALSFLDKLAESLPPERVAAPWAAELAKVRKQLQAATQPATVPAPG